MPTNFTLANAEELSPNNISQRIIREISNNQGNGNYISSQAFPLYEMGSSEEVYHRLTNMRSPAGTASLGGESNIAPIEGLEADNMTVETIKEKISPEKGVQTALNSQQDIMNVFEYVADSLRVDLLRSRSYMTWRHFGSTPGCIGRDGLTPHPDIPNDHVVVPGTQFTDTANSDPHKAFMTAARQISEDGNFDKIDAPTVDAYVPTSVLWDLKDSDNLESRFSGVEVQNINNVSQLTQVLPIDGQVREIRTTVPRVNSDGEPVDENATVVEISEAAEDNILEPYDVSNSTKRRNIVLGVFDRQTAVQGFFLDRIAEHMGSAPSGRWNVDMSNGFLLQGWTGHDPAVSWRKIASETGFEVLRGDNLAILQDV